MSSPKTPAKKRAYRRKWYAENRERYKEKYRRYTLKSKHGITLEQRKIMFEAQGCCCAICKADEPGGHGHWHLDHCHSTGKLRGLLCSHCNLALGHVKDNPETLKRMIAYLAWFT